MVVIAADDPVGVGCELMVTPELPRKLELGPAGVVGVGGLLMVTPVLLLKLELRPDLAADDSVRLLVVSVESRTIFWGAGLVGSNSKPAFNCRGADLFG